MIAFDTNVLLRLYVKDDETQHVAARRLLTAAEKRGEAVWISCPVLCELVWALHRLYGIAKPICLELIEGLVESPMFVVENVVAVRNAIRRQRAGRGDFADYLIQELAQAQGIAQLYTYDKALLKEAGFAKP